MDTGKYRINDLLCRLLEGGLLEKDAKKFIENDGAKQYRNKSKELGLRLTEVDNLC